jgi:hypothetical protein
MCTVKHLAEEVRFGLRSVLPDLNKSPLGKLSLCVAAAPEVRTCNTMDIASVLPLGTDRRADLGVFTPLPVPVAAKQPEKPVRSQALRRQYPQDSEYE